MGFVLLGRLEELSGRLLASHVERWYTPDLLVISRHIGIYLEYE